MVEFAEFLNESMVMAFIFGTIVGILIQRSNFCTVAAFRDAFIFKRFDDTKALIVGVGVMIFLFSFWMTFVPARANPVHLPLGWYSLVGGLIFGMGMTLAGFCSITSCTRSGEGYVGAWLSLLFIFVGVVSFVWFWNFFPWPPMQRLLAVPNPSSFHFGVIDGTILRNQNGIPPLLFPGLFLIFMLYLIYRKLEEIEAIEFTGRDKEH